MRSLQNNWRSSTRLTKLLILAGAVATMVCLWQLWVWFALGNDAGSKQFNPSSKQVNNYEECAAAGYAIAESYPQQCITPGGDVFVNTNATVSE